MLTRTQIYLASRATHEYETQAHMESTVALKFHNLVERLRNCWKVEEATMSESMKKRLSLQYSTVIKQMRMQLAAAYSRAPVERCVPSAYM